MRNGVARHSSAAANFGNIADACGLAQAVPAALLTTPCCSDWPNSRIPKRGSETPCRSRRFLTTPSSSRSVPSSIRPVFGWGGFFASESRGWGSRCARRTRRHAEAGAEARHRSPPHRNLHRKYLRPESATRAARRLTRRRSRRGVRPVRPWRECRTGRKASPARKANACENCVPWRECGRRRTRRGLRQRRPRLPGRG